MRAQQTAELAGLHVDAIDPDLAEWDYGDYEGLTTAQIRERDPGWTHLDRPVARAARPRPRSSARADRVLARAQAALAARPATGRWSSSRTVISAG